MLVLYCKPLPEQLVQLVGLLLDYGANPRAAAHLQELANSLKPHIIPTPRKYYDWSDNLEPDVWFEPVKVWVVKAADLSISPVHRAAKGLMDSVKGISIRFPRLIRVAEMYQKQAVVNNKGEEEEEY